jgi:hypothetical protein
MEHISLQFPAGTTSVGDLIEVIRTKLLVVDLPPVNHSTDDLGQPIDNSGSSSELPFIIVSPPNTSTDETPSIPALPIEPTQPKDHEHNGLYRASARKVVISLDLILQSLRENSDYCFANRLLDALQGPQNARRHLYQVWNTTRRMSKVQCKSQQILWQAARLLNVRKVRITLHLCQFRNTALRIPIGHCKSQKTPRLASHLLNARNA